ncbi:MAG: DNA topoisomerase IV subunit A [Burkholderiaceae bacterium]|nr:DNA topoisomerase IV subunit A [Burkholderiaceae bacterium]
MDNLDLFSGAGPDSGDDAITLGEYAERAYLDYAVSVVKGRALPDVADGQKPVQRRILYAMHEMGLGPSAKPVKSARVVGDVLGRYHPHGDTAAYDALVRMAQSFTLRYPLIDGQGNFGSRDGDGAAAMRYTEARLTRYAELLLEEIDSGTVDFVPNYDGSTNEPALLPARLPMVLLNGASGIAVGMATEIPPHNLREVAAATIEVLRNPDADIDSVMALLPAPDFPGGGQVITPTGDLREIYAGGRGSIKVRARFDFEELARGQWQLVVNELPHGVSSQKVLEEIEEISNPKVRAGKKSLTPEQQNLKQAMLALLDAVRDESGKDAAVRLVIEPKTSRVDRDAMVRMLLAHTSLEASVSVNLVMIGIDGRPRQKGVVEVLREWCSFRIDTVTRRSRFRLGKVDDRIHILEGRQLVLLHIDEVIRIIRESDEPKPALIARFGLSDRQAEDILEIRLRQLARLETIRIEKELAGLRDEKKKLESLLASPSAMRRQVIREVEADAKTYGDERRTLVEAAERAVVEVRVPEEPVTVIVSEKGWVRARQGHGHDWSQFGFKSGDGFYGAFEAMTTDNLYAVATNGKVYSIPVSQLPSARGDGAPLTTFFELEPGARIDHAFATSAQTGVMLASDGGMGFICQAKDLIGRTRSGKSFFSVGDAETPLRPALFEPGMDRVLCAASDGRVLVFALDEMKVLKNGGRGVILMGVEPKSPLSAAIVFGRDGVVVAGIGRGAKALERAFSGGQLEAYRGVRARKGRLLEPRIRDASLRLPRPDTQA